MTTSINSIELAQFLLVKAVDLDEKGRWTESLNYYQEGVTALLKYVQGKVLNILVAIYQVGSVTP